MKTEQQEILLCHFIQDSSKVNNSDLFHQIYSVLNQEGFNLTSLNIHRDIMDTKKFIIKTKLLFIIVEELLSENKSTTVFRNDIIDNYLKISDFQIPVLIYYTDDFNSYKIHENYPNQIKCFHNTDMHVLIHTMEKLLYKPSENSFR